MKEEILKFAIVPQEICVDDRLTLVQYKVLIALLTCRNRSTVLCNPSRDYLEAMTCLPPTRISKTTSELVQLWLLKKIEKCERSSSNIYEITTPDYVSKRVRNRLNEYYKNKNNTVTDSVTVTDSIIEA